MHSRAFLIIDGVPLAIDNQCHNQVASFKCVPLSQEEHSEEFNFDSHRAVVSSEVNGKPPYRSTDSQNSAGDNHCCYTWRPLAITRHPH
jgi:hypothetical protein